MNRQRICGFLIGVMALFGVMALAAESERNNTVYAGGGSDAFVIGALFDRGASFAYGVDVAQEGLMTDRTGGSAGIFYDYVPNDTKKAASINAIVALPLSLGQSASDVVLGALLGARTTRRECPSGQSNLGYACYADEDPDVSYKVNGGILVAYRRTKMFVGARVTGESQTLLLGFRF